MTERLRSPIVDSVARGAAFASLVIAGVVARLSGDPVAALKAGGLASLIVAFVALLKAGELEEAPAGAGRRAAEQRRRQEATAQRLSLARVALGFAAVASGLLAMSLVAARVMP